MADNNSMIFSLRDIILYYIKEEEAEEFAVFAFGKDYDKICISKFRMIWNDNHGEQYFLQGNGKPEKDISEMIKVWKKSRH